MRFWRYTAMATALYLTRTPPQTDFRQHSQSWRKLSNI